MEARRRRRRLNFQEPFTTNLYMGKQLFPSSSLTFGKVDVILNGRFSLKVPQIAQGKETAGL